ncbi:MAG: orotidine-5'-phosphate decarboxylase [Candidatus Nealsonbacteria bacterium]|nr:orotidine-5'-phosphate decarboxylase [Candidatus Nealsonbacteria bacterium]
MKIRAKERLIFALDVKDLNSAIHLLNELEGRGGMVKVNSLAVAHPEIVALIQDRNIKVWRDFKHHDIPGTVANYIEADTKDGIAMTTIHTLGGKKMMGYAVRAAEKSNLKILGITILTSHDQEIFNKEIGIPSTIQEEVIKLAKMAEEVKLDGVVASAKEAMTLRKNLKSNTLIITPGIKPLWAVRRADQARVITPYQAILDGSDYLVVGSAIRTSNSPGEATNNIVSEIENALSDRVF